MGTRAVRAFSSVVRLTNSKMKSRSHGVGFPSDLAGIVLTAVDQGETWKITLFDELKAAGYTLDANAGFPH